MKTKSRTVATVMGAVLALGFSAHAALVEGADQKPVQVSPGSSAPSAAAPPAATPAPAGAPGLSRRQRRAAAAAAAAAAAGSAVTPAAAGAGTTATSTTGGTVIGDKDYNSCKKFPAGKRIVKLNLKPDTELGDLISWISSITCKQFLLPGTIPANSKKVTIVAPELITPEEAYRLFLGALDSVGLTVQPSGKVLRIIETVKAKSAPIPLYGEDSDVPVNESYVTRLIHVENADPNEVAQVLGRLKGEQGDVIVYAPQNALIVTDLATNITRMMAILKEIDQPGSGEKVWIIGIKNTSAGEMAQKLGDIFQVAKLGGKGGTTSTPPPPGSANRGKPGDLTTEMMISKIIPDERSNQLIVIANERAYARVLTLVKKLDVPIEGGDGRIHVYYCENANCDELAQTIGAVTGISVSGAGASRSRSSRSQSTATPTPPTPTSGTPGQTLTGANMLFEGEVRLNFDRPTNSLIIVSSLKDYQSLRRVIELLDSPRKQVFVEAMVLEVTLDKERDLGASWHGVKPQNLFGLSDPSLIVGGLNPSTTLVPTNALGDTMLAGILGPVLSPAEAAGLGTAVTSTVDIPSFGVLINALQTNNDVDVLSNPHLLIMNNEDGEISVGQRVPFPVSTIGLGGAGAPGGASPTGALGLGLGSLFPQVQREKVALEMKLTPHVNEHDIIRLEVDEKISELAPGSSNLGPSTSERTAKTIVVAKDQQTILIGGLMSDKVINSNTKIPLLGDIPILGFFFRNTTKHVVKTNLIIALTPYVITDQSDLRRVLEKKMRERREFVERFGGEERPTLESDIDYRRKRGMLEEINRAAREIEKEEGEMADIARKESMDESGPVELPVGPSSSLPIGPPGGNGAPPASPPASSPSPSPARAP
jgi:general secretion pathway protein D